jgi:hypothetical protein
VHAAAHGGQRLHRLHGVDAAFVRNAARRARAAHGRLQLAQLFAAERLDAAGWR